jgi:hypothetical protein
MSKDAKRKEKLKKEKNKKEVLDKFPKLVIFKEEEAPEGSAVIFKKCYRELLTELNFKKDKTRNEVLGFELLKAIVKYDFDLSSSDTYFVKKIMQNTFFMQSHIYFKNSFGHNVRKFLSAISQLTISCITSYLYKKTNFEKYFPDYFFNIGFLNNQIYIKFFKVKIEKNANGTLYKHFKNINVDGQTYEIHFTAHALSRICQRIMANHDNENSPEAFLNYAYQNVTLDTFADFITHAQFEFCGFSKNQHLLCCYMPLNHQVDKMIKKNNFQKYIFDIPHLKNQKYDKLLMRYFYFPFFVSGNKIICKSSLLAGFSGTPEFYLRNSIIDKRTSIEGLAPPEQENLVIDIMKDFYSKQKSNSFVFSDEFYMILILFHSLGKPQFFKGELTYFPFFAKLTKELLEV